MPLTPINVITILIGIGFLLTGYSLVKRGRENIELFLLSAIIGAGLVIVGFSPDLFQQIVEIIGFQLTGVSRGRSRAIFVVSNLTLFVLVAYLFNRIGKLNDHISRLNEELSLLKTEVRENRDE